MNKTGHKLLFFYTGSSSAINLYGDFAFTLANVHNRSNKLRSLTPFLLYMSMGHGTMMMTSHDRDRARDDDITQRTQKDKTTLKQLRTTASEATAEIGQS